jgi:DNA-binding transcriptional LysR family regulator
MNQLQAIRVFVRLAETESFGRTAASLNLSNAAVSRHIALLEAHLHTRLVNRTTRCVALTDAGRVYAERCAAILEQIDTLDGELGCAIGAPTGVLRIVAQTSFAFVHLTPVLAAYRRSCRRVRIAMSTTDEPVDLVERGYDIGLLPPALMRGSTMVSRPLVDIPAAVVASRGYLEARKPPASPAALRRHPVLTTTGARSLAIAFEGHDAARQEIAIEPALSSPNALTIRQAALAGLGIAILPVDMVQGDLDGRTLVHLLTDYRLPGFGTQISIVYQGRRHLAARTREFVELALAHFRPDAAANAPPRPIAAPSSSARSGA